MADRYTDLFNKQTGKVSSEDILRVWENSDKVRDEQMKQNLKNREPSIPGIGGVEPQEVPQLQETEIQPEPEGKLDDISGPLYSMLEAVGSYGVSSLPDVSKTKLLDDVLSPLGKIGASAFVKVINGIDDFSEAVMEGVSENIPEPYESTIDNLTKLDDTIESRRVTGFRPVSKAFDIIGRLSELPTFGITQLFSKDYISSVVAFANGDLYGGLEKYLTAHAKLTDGLVKLSGWEGSEARDKYKEENPEAGSFFGWLSNPDNVNTLKDIMPESAVTMVNTYLTDSVKDRTDLSAALLTLVEGLAEGFTDMNLLSIGGKMAKAVKGSTVQSRLINNVDQFLKGDTGVVMKVAEDAKTLADMDLFKFEKLTDTVSDVKIVLEGYLKTLEEMSSGRMAERGFVNLSIEGIDEFAKKVHKNTLGRILNNKVGYTPEYNKLIGTTFHPPEKVTKGIISGATDWLKESFQSFYKLKKVTGVDDKYFFEAVQTKFSSGMFNTSVKATEAVRDCFTDSLQWYGEYGGGKGILGRMVKKYKKGVGRGAKVVNSHVDAVCGTLKARDTFRRDINQMIRDDYKSLMEEIKPYLPEDYHKGGKLDYRTIRDVVEELADRTDITLFTNKKYVNTFPNGETLTVRDMYQKIKNCEKYLDDNNLWGDHDRVVEALHKHGTKLVEEGFLNKETIESSKGYYFPNDVDYEITNRISGETSLAAALQKEIKTPKGVIRPTAAQLSESSGNFSKDSVTALTDYFNSANRLELRGKIYRDVLDRYAVNSRELLDFMTGKEIKDPKSMLKFFSSKKDDNGKPILHEGMRIIYYAEEDALRTILKRTARAKEGDALLDTSSKTIRNKRKAEKNKITEEQEMHIASVREHLLDKKDPNNYLSFIEDVFEGKDLETILKDNRLRFQDNTLGFHAKVIVGMLDARRNKILGHDVESTQFYQALADTLKIAKNLSKGERTAEVFRQIKSGVLAEGVEELGRNRMAIVPSPVADALTEVFGNRAVIQIDKDNKFMSTVSNGYMTLANRIKKSMTVGSVVDFFKYNLRNSMEAANVFSMHPEAFEFLGDAVTFLKEDLGNVGKGFLEATSIPTRAFQGMDYLVKKVSDPVKSKELRANATKENLIAWRKDYLESGSGGYTAELEKINNLQGKKEGSLASALRGQRDIFKDFFVDTIGLGDNHTPIIGDARRNLEKVTILREDMLRQAVYYSQRAKGLEHHTALSVVDKVLVNFGGFNNNVNFMSSAVFNFLKTKVGFAHGWARQLGDLYDMGKEGRYAELADKTMRSVGAETGLILLGYAMKKEFESPFQAAISATPLDAVSEWLMDKAVGDGELGFVESLTNWVRKDFGMSTGFWSDIYNGVFKGTDKWGKAISEEDTNFGRIMDYFTHAVKTTSRDMSSAIRLMGIVEDDSLASAIEEWLNGQFIPGKKRKEE